MADDMSFDVAIGTGETVMCSPVKYTKGHPIKGKLVPMTVRVPPEQYILGRAYNFRLEGDGKTYLWADQRPETIQGEGWAVFTLDWATATLA